MKKIAIFNEGCVRESALEQKFEKSFESNELIRGTDMDTSDYYL